MTRALVVVATTLGLALPAGAAPAFCAEVSELLANMPDDGAAAWARYGEIEARLPASARPVAEHARRRAGEGGSLAAAYAALQAALADGCRDARAELPEDPAGEVAALMAGDERFTGPRHEPDAVDRMKAAISLWLEELLESQLMRRYAGASRSVYLAGLLVFVLFVAFRLWRARARRRRALLQEEARATLTRVREKAFAAWREEADAHLSRGAVREALRAGQRALLARVGEVERDAVTPARTGREVLARCGDEERALIAPPLGVFERAYYGGRADAEVAARFLRAVDDAALGLAARG